MKNTLSIVGITVGVVAIFAGIFMMGAGIEVMVLRDHCEKITSADKSQTWYECPTNLIDGK